MVVRDTEEEITLVKAANASGSAKPPVEVTSMKRLGNGTGVVDHPRKPQLNFSKISHTSSNISNFRPLMVKPDQNYSLSTSEIRVCTQEERLQHIRSQCKKLRSKMPSEYLRPARRTIADEIHHLLFCYMSKVGCTAFKILLTKANVHAMGRNNTYPKGMNVHNRQKLAREYQLPELYYFNTKETEWRLSEYFKFMIMRHPFERLISAWRDKVVNIKQSEFKDWPAKILKHTRPYLFGNASTARSSLNTDQAIAAKHSPPRFDEFVTWIAEQKISNEHWLSAIESCHVCAHDWDAIFRIETMVKDKTILLDRLKDDIDPSKDIAVVHSMQSNPNYFFPVKELDLWKNISRPVVNYFLEKYQDDMQLFGYQWDREHSRTVCSISTPSGQCC